MDAKTTVKVIIPFDTFEQIYNRLKGSARCSNVWCSYSLTTCHVRELREGIREWWNQTNGSAPGFGCYERVFQNAINIENRFYWAFWTHQMQPAEVVYEELIKEAECAFQGAPIDILRLPGNYAAWPTAS